MSEEVCNHKTKVCSNCGVERFIDNFNTRKDNNSIRNYCNICHNLFTTSSDSYLHLKDIALPGTKYLAELLSAMAFDIDMEKTISQSTITALSKLLRWQKIEVMKRAQRKISSEIHASREFWRKEGQL